MTEETSIAIPDDVRAAFMAFDDDYLADVLRLWNCDLKCWYEPCMIVFRFESDDMFIWIEKGSLKSRRGAMNTEIVDPEQCQLTLDPNNSNCLAWITDHSFSHLLGRRSKAKKLLKSLASTSYSLEYSLEPNRRGIV